jgi:type I restriction-modification system DNA methylase subunit
MNGSIIVVDKENAKQQIKELVEKYNKVVEEKRRYNEADTKAEFIEPLFEALGWDVRNKALGGEVTREETISKKRVDYGFRINGIPKFFLEAKALKTDLNDSKFIRQAINYAWWKTCNWAVLSDFENVMIFNCQWKAENLLQNLLRSISCQQFLDRFKDLWLLSKESFEKGLLDKVAETECKKARPIRVDQQLLDDLTRWRNMLSKNISNYNKDKNIPEDELDETVQRLLNRLVFIRKAEDSGLEEKVLQQALRGWENDDSKALYIRLGEIFKKFRETYDSELFDEARIDEVIMTNDVLREVINGLYDTKDKLREYNFTEIDADILGNVYEQYLGHLLKKTKKRVDVKESHAHRKEQGIYYTPTYIVDYIVKNTLGELLKNKKVDVKKIRVLDLACGSGSFLIKAFDILNEHYSKHDKDYTQAQLDTTGEGTTFTKKVEILHNNIFGVDLDKQAIEIARLNLLLKIAEKGRRLPLLRENIKCGNSLIDGEKVSGDKAFKWQKKFTQIMDEGGFDVIIGNPPYVNAKELMESQPEVRNYLDNSPDFETLYQKWDLYIPFIERSLKLLKDENSYFSMIIPLPYVNQMYAKKSRQFIVNKFSLKKIVDLSDWKVFQDATVKNCIIVVSKPKKVDNEVEIVKLDTNRNFYIHQKVKQDQISLPETLVWNIKNIERLSISGKNFIRLGDCCFVSKGMVLNADETKAKGQFKKKDLISKTPTKIHTKKYVEGKDIDKFCILRYRYLEWDTKRVPDLLSRPTFSELYECPKVLVNKLGEIKATLDTENLYCEQTIRVVVLFKYLKGVENRSINNSLQKYYRLSRGELEKKSEPIDYRYLLGFLNSKLANALLDQIRGSDNIDINPEYLKQLPIRVINFSDPKERKSYDEIVSLVDKMLSLNKRLGEIRDKKTDERARIEEDIKKTDAEIDELVYKLYGITNEEQKIIEESLK